MYFRFGSFVLDTQRYELRSDNEIIHIEPQVFDVLAYLLMNRDRVVGKNELFDEIWGSRFVTESTLTSRIKLARQAIGDDGQRQGMIQTVRGRGFRFVAPVQVDTPSQPDDRGGSRPFAALPVVLGELIGRRDELAAAAVLLRKTRLVTLVGPGGVGKTRFAIETAAQTSSALSLQVSFVDLVPAQDATDVARAISDAVGLRTETAQSPLDALCAALRSEERLLVLDNFEHVLDAADVVSALVSAAPRLRVLVTSRERLRLPGEQVFALDPLSRARSDASLPPAVELFASVAQRMDPAFTIDDSNYPDVLALCDAVDGLPLGIELLAAYVRLMPPGQLRRELGDRLSSLQADARRVPARQRTLRDTIEWSLRLLTEQERAFLIRLAAFRSGAELAAVERVCQPGLPLDPITALGALLDKSLLRRRIGADGAPRFSMLELVREQVRRRLEESPDLATTRDRHAAYYHDLVWEVEHRRWCELADSWMATLNEHFADIEVALSYDFTDGDAQRGARTVAGLGCYWHRSWRLAAGSLWTQRALAQAASLTPIERGLLHEAAGYLAFRSRRTDEAREHFQQALDCFTAAGHDRYRALATVDLAGTFMGDPVRAARAIGMCQDAVMASRAVGDVPLIAHAVNVLGELTRLHGDLSEAWAANREGLLLCRQTGDELHQVIFEMNLSTLALRRGDHTQAREFVRAALRRSVALGSQASIAHGLYTAADVELATESLARAAELLGAADALFEALGVAPGPGDQPEYVRVCAALESALGPQQLAELTAAGRRLSTSEAVARALA